MKKYGSDELQGFFGQNARHTFKSFSYSLFMWRSDYTAHEDAKNEDSGMSHTSPSTPGEPTCRQRLEERMAGCRAYLGGVSKSQNPYPLEDRAPRLEWHHGYSPSTTDRFIANREAGGASCASVVAQNWL